jgi:NAD(P)-dependent dehydrogenase (short-subunit alcohol dehydrogenase family)
MDPRPDHGEKSYRGSGRLAGRKALITGGDSGMGRAAAIAYAREGADVAINYFPTEEHAKEVIELIKAQGRIGLAIPGNLRDEKFCQELVASAIEDLGSLDIIVSNAGRQQTRASILYVSSDDFDATTKDPVENRSMILRVFLPFVFGYYIAYMFRTINAVMAVPLATELGLGADDLGLLTSVYFLTLPLPRYQSASSSTDVVHGGSRACCCWSRRSARRCLRCRIIF